MKGMKIYISGKITGIEKQAEKLFEDAENQLIRKGLTPVNPMKLPHNHERTWEAYMRECTKALYDCQAIYMLKNWTDSKGAAIERAMAMNMQIPIIYQK